MKYIKRVFLFVILLFTLLCFKNIAFASTTISKVFYNGVTYNFFNPLTLTNDNNSYYVFTNNNINQFIVVEPYNSSDKLATYSNINNSNYSSVTDYNILRGVNSNKNLRDVNYYITTYENGSWSEWVSYTSSNFIYKTNEYSYIPIMGNNVDIYTYWIRNPSSNSDLLLNESYLPNGITFKDNIAIITCSNGDTFLLYTSNKNNHFYYTDTVYYCKTSSNSSDSMNVYKFDSNTKTFKIANSNVTQKSVSSASSTYFCYSFNFIDYKGTIFECGYNTFFKYIYEYYNFPYIVNSSEDLAGGLSESILIFPEDFKNYEDITFFIYEYGTDITQYVSGGLDNVTVFNSVLNSNNSYYHSENNEFWYEIPLEDYSSLLVDNNRYIFGIFYYYDDEYHFDGKSIFWHNIGLTSTITESNEQKQAIEELSSTINNQTEIIKEQHETSKSILGKIGDILSYINPFSDNFFAYKLVELIINGLKSLFIPEERFF